MRLLEIRFPFNLKYKEIGTCLKREPPKIFDRCHDLAAENELNGLRFS